LSRRIWPPSGKSRWYYERTRGQYQDEIGRSSRAEATKFKEANPPSQRFTKADAAKYVFAWEKRPDRVSLGSQKNFIHFSEEWLRSKGDDWLPDDVWYRALVAKAIVYNTTRTLVRAASLPGYSGNVVAYIVSLLAARAGDHFDLEYVWAQQRLSQQLCDVLTSWIRPVYDALVATSNGRNVTEWAKKSACWDALSATEFDPLSTSIPEIQEGAVSDPERSPVSSSPRGDSTSLDLTEDREKVLRMARAVTNGKVMKREDAIKELQTQLGIQRLSSERRRDLESVLDDLPRVAFIDDPETVETNRALAIVRKHARSGAETREDLYRTIAIEWLNAKRVGSKIRADIDAILKVARRRRILDFEGEAVLCPTPTFEAYDDFFLSSLILDLMTRKGRIYFRRMIAEEVIAALGFSHARTEMLSRIEQAIESLVAAGNLIVPVEATLQRP
jgi:hypothetical protein